MEHTTEAPASPRLGRKSGSLLGDWISRILSDRIPHQAMVHPCIIDGRHTLVHERGLAAADPAAYRQIADFAAANGFAVKEDQRKDFIAGVKRVKNRRHANVITIMALATSLLSTSFSARSAAVAPEAYQDREITRPHGDDAMDLSLGVYESDKELATALLGWINAHSSFEHSVDVLPEIVKVNAMEMAGVAFGGELPAAIDPEKLQIYGLYNFNEGTVYILDSLDLDTGQGRGVLLHELVHFLQYQYEQDENAACRNELESLAYILEAKYLQAHDHDHRISMEHIRRVSQCG